MAQALLPYLTSGCGSDVLRRFHGTGSPVSVQYPHRPAWVGCRLPLPPASSGAGRRSVLLDRPSVDAIWGPSVETVAQDAEGVCVSARGGGSELVATARCLPGGDGGRSFGRKRLGVELDNVGFDEPWIVVDVNVDGPVTIPDFKGTPPGIDMPDVLFIIGGPDRPTSEIPGTRRHRRWEFLLLWLAEDHGFPPGRGDFATRLKAPLECFAVTKAVAGRSPDRAQLVDDTGELLEPLDYHDCVGVLLRPDLHVFAVLTSYSEAAELVECLAVQLGAGQ